jgi:hypothetical protein
MTVQTEFLIAGEWQKKYDYAQVRQNFNQPPLFYAPHTFWFWDAPLDADLTASMAKEMTKKGLNPGYAHPRHSGARYKPYPSLPPEEWLSPLWFQSFKTALSEAEKAGMTLGYCDEYWWPSGQADGRVLEKHPELAAQSLEWNRQIVNGPGEATIPNSKFSVAGQLLENNRIIANTLKIIGEDNMSSWPVPAGKWVIYSYNLYHHAGVDGGEVNYLDPGLMDVFISIAHESYEKNLGERMGRSIPGVFVDNEGDYGWKMAWSDYLAKRYKQMKNRDIRLWLPLLTEKDTAGLWAKARYDWFDVVSDVYSTQYLGRLSDWLEKHGMYYISNLWEEDLMLQTRAVGDMMRAQRAVTMPGNDCLEMKSQQVHDFKEIQSVCEFEDRPFMSELMGVAGWEQTPAQMKMTLNGVTAWGVTHTVPHGINLNRKLETIPYPADWFTENPYWRYMNLWTDFARRASFVNRQGQLVADILLINPLESVWALSEGYFTSTDGNKWPEKVTEINSIYSDVMDVLTSSRLDYLIADGFYMKKASVSKSTNQHPASLNIANHNFSVLILPPMFIISQSTSQKILEFAQSGGSVILLGDLPMGSPETGASDPLIVDQMKKLINLPSVLNLATEKDKIKLLPGKIKEMIKSQIEILSGNLPLIVSHRKIGNNDFFWLANNTEQKQTCTLGLRDGKGRAEIWDCETGLINPVSYQVVKGRNIVSIDFEPYQAFWLVFNTNDKPVIIKEKKRKKEKEIKLSGPWQLSYPETKTIQMTSARALITSDTINHPEFFAKDYDASHWDWLSMLGRIRIIDSWRASLFYNPDPESNRYYRYKFFLNDIPEGALANINADNIVWFWINGKPVKPGLNSTILTGIDLHDISSDLRKGENIIAVKTTNHPGHGTMILQGMVQLVNGDTFDILTGPSWKESKVEIAGWQEVDFDDTSWKNAVLASESMRERDVRGMRKPAKVAFTKNRVWWRLDIPPGAREVTLAGLSGKAKIWVDNTMMITNNEKITLPIQAKILLIKGKADDDGLSQPATFRCTGPGPAALGSWLDLGLRNFTGFVDYETHFTITEKDSSVKIDLGRVLHMAEVWINDIKVGERLWPPFTFDISKAVQAGKNRIRIRIGNLMVNEMGLKDDLGELRLWGWRGVPLDSSYDAGLFGPVSLSIVEN